MSTSALILLGNRTDKDSCNVECWSSSPSDLELLFFSRVSLCSLWAIFPYNNVPSLYYDALGNSH